MQVYDCDVANIFCGVVDCVRCAIVCDTAEGPPDEANFEHDVRNNYLLHLFAHPQYCMTCQSVGR